MRGLLLALALGLGACSGYWHPHYLLSSEAEKRVTDAAFRYNNALRFGNLEMAVACVHPDQRPAFLALFSDAAASPIRFTEVEIQSVSLGPEPDEARVLSTLRLYRLPSVREVSVNQEQRWRYDPDDETWYVAPDLELFARAGRLR